MRGRKLDGSLLNVMFNDSKNLFIPESRDCGVLAVVSTEGIPSNTMTRSARYVAMMKSCSTIKPVFLACNINLLKMVKINMRVYGENKRIKNGEVFALDLIYS